VGGAEKFIKEMFQRQTIQMVSSRMNILKTSLRLLEKIAKFIGNFIGKTTF